MTKGRPKGKMRIVECLVCKRRVKVRSNGQIIRHWFWNGSRYTDEVCAGSGVKIDERQ